MTGGEEAVDVEPGRMHDLYVTNESMAIFERLTGEWEAWVNDGDGLRPTLDHEATLLMFRVANQIVRYAERTVGE